MKIIEYLLEYSSAAVKDSRSKDTRGNQLLHFLSCLLSRVKQEHAQHSSTNPRDAAVSFVRVLLLPQAWGTLNTDDGGEALDRTTGDHRSATARFVAGKMWKNAGYSKSEDLESGAQPLYPGMLESPDLRWALIRKIYFILSVQVALTVVVSSVVVAVRPISQFIVSSSVGFAVFVLIFILPLIGTLQSWIHFLCSFNYFSPILHFSLLIACSAVLSISLSSAAPC